MKTLVVSDVHGLSIWKDAMKEVEDDVTVVFLGDYFDLRGKGPFANDQVDNFLEICDYVKNNPDAKMLIGNHDWQYLPWDEIGCGGRDDRNLPRYRKALMDNIDLIDMVHIISETESAKPMIFSHAGVSETFMRIIGKSDPSKMNELWKERPELFNFRERGSNGSFSNMYGDNAYQSPIWIRPNALADDSLSGYDQCVGHTVVPHIMTIDGSGGKILLTCTLNDEMVIVDSE